jgi:hypothetical protein
VQHLVAEVVELDHLLMDKEPLDVFQSEQVVLQEMVNLEILVFAL